MRYIKDTISILIFLIGMCGTLIGIMLAGEQYRVQQDYRGMLIGLTISLLGIIMIRLGCYLLTRLTRREKDELYNKYIMKENKYIK